MHASGQAHGERTGDRGPTHAADMRGGKTGDWGPTHAADMRGEKTGDRGPTHAADMRGERTGDRGPTHAADMQTHAVCQPGIGWALDSRGVGRDARPGGLRVPHGLWVAWTALHGQRAALQPRPQHTVTYQNTAFLRTEALLCHQSAKGEETAHTQRRAFRPAPALPRASADTSGAPAVRKRCGDSSRINRLLSGTRHAAMPKVWLEPVFTPCPGPCAGTAPAGYEPRCCGAVAARRCSKAAARVWLYCCNTVAVRCCRQAAGRRLRRKQYTEHLLGPRAPALRRPPARLQLGLDACQVLLCDRVV
eukprot:365429-Chlamydomonas_euryale.AAC.1